MGIRYRAIKYYKRNNNINKIRQINKKYNLRARNPKTEPSAPADKVKVVIKELRKTLKKIKQGMCCQTNKDVV